MIIIHHILHQLDTDTEFCRESVMNNELSHIHKQ